MAITSLDFQIDRSDWRRTRLVENDVPELAPNQVLFRVDRFALTSNNISYAAAGDMLDYWGFFPSGEEGWLVKCESSSAGLRVHRYPHGIRPRATTYYQRFVPGQAVGAVYLSGLGRAQLLGITEHFVGTPWAGAAGFWYAGSVGPLTVPTAVFDQFARKKP